MPEPINTMRPIQVFLDTQRLIQTMPTGTRGPNKDFFAGDNSGFERHKKRLRRKIADASSSLRSQGDPAGFLLVQMREEGLGKSYRPLGALFTPRNRFALVGGASIGEMFFQATPEALDHLDGLIEARAEIEPKVVLNSKTGREEERVSSYRSELGAIEDIRVPMPSDRLSFSARDAVRWLEEEDAIGGYIVELFRPDPKITPEAIHGLVERFEHRLQELGGVIALPFGGRGSYSVRKNITLSIDLSSGDGLIKLPAIDKADDDVFLEGQTDTTPTIPVDRGLARHQALLDLLSREPLVRRIEPPLRIEGTPTRSAATTQAASISPPAHDESYPIIGIIDGGVADVDALRPWRAGGTSFLPDADKDEEHGSFIAGLLTGAASLNPSLADHFEKVPCRFYDVDLMPRRGRLSNYFQSPDEFFDQLDEQIAKAKADHGVRVFNMSLGSPGARQGLGYSSFAAQLDRIAIEHDVVFVVSAGNLRGAAARPPWPADPDVALGLLAGRVATDERITAPGDHLYGCTVAALNPPSLMNVVDGVPTTYSRRGPGPGGARKPELCQIGGITPRDGNRSGLYSIGLDGNLVDGAGTSYAAPLVAATIGALDHRLEGRARRETLLALPVHNATRPAPMQAKQFRTLARDFVGFGIPASAETCLTDAQHSITLVFSDTLPPRRELSFVFTWPRSLTTEAGKCRGQVSCTLAYTPPVDAAFDAECQRVQLDAHLYQLEEKEVDGNVKEDPQSRLNHTDNALPEHLAYTERYLLESGLKWTPIKRYERNMPRGIGTRGEWRLSLKALTRAGVIFPEDGVPFTLIMTISDPKEQAPIYDEVRAEIARRGLRLADITVNPRIRIRA
jgi:subtilisin family serine protease